MRSCIGPLLCLCLLVPLAGCDDDPSTPLTPEQQLDGNRLISDTTPVDGPAIVYRKTSRIP